MPAHDPPLSREDLVRETADWPVEPNGQGALNPTLDPMSEIGIIGRPLKSIISFEPKANAPGLG